ncbi:hypothetical protein OF83DRAFT_296227 [Amylostereum chailletii]|nr:hypothetical protein OF83DRAFT_296227 [Amylostereum chailletii]
MYDVLDAVVMCIPPNQTNLKSPPPPPTQYRYPVSLLHVFPYYFLPLVNGVGVVSCIFFVSLSPSLTLSLCLSTPRHPFFRARAPMPSLSFPPLACLLTIYVYSSRNRMECRAFSSSLADFRRGGEGRGADLGCFAF